MDIDMLSTFISNVGFPIAAFAAMYYMCNTTIKEVKGSIDELAQSISTLLDHAKQGGVTDKE